MPEGASDPGSDTPLDGAPDDGVQSDKAKIDNRARLREITAVLRKHHISRGVTPEKLRAILEELGPTYVKLGQIMSLHSDVLPQRYCDELMKLTSEVTPMPFSEVEEVINRSYREDWRNIFASIEHNTLGSASIAQVHKARLLDGRDVIVKVERKGIYDTMARDIGLLKRAVGILPPIGGLKNVVDLEMVLDELWSTAQEEMDFLKEAANMEEFARNNQGINYIRCPKLYHEYTTSRVLVMEYIGGCPVDDKNKLLAEGYDLGEIGRKLVNNYIKQVMEDGFFHADPHPGNVKVMDGKIVWIDMGMMGRLTYRDRNLMATAVRAIAVGDIAVLESTILELGDVQGKIDSGKLYGELRDLMDRYGNASMGSIDAVEFFKDVMEIMKGNDIRLPHGMTMLVRGLTQMQGVLLNISPDINMAEIAAGRLREEMLQNFDWKKEAGKTGRRIYKAAGRTLDIPPLVKIALEEYLKGQARINMELDSTRKFSQLMRRLVRNLVMGLWVMALLISSSIICTTDMQPRLLGIPALGFFGYSLAFVICLYVFIRHLLTRNK
ncbi:MAG: AarF/ABC1/UbiB kinase family protein [Lachnospiraceae bacterium]|nr:AarF/ABC1/UbiB kinase family protein [Lachnospiraceae bacterium]